MAAHIAPYERYSENFLFARSDSGVLTVTLNRPERLNAFLYSMFDEIADLWYDVAKDDATKAVIITGAGRGFCAGNDLSQPDADHRQIIKLMENGRRRTNGILALDKPVIGAINGPAVGIGLAVALMCDITVVAEDAVLIEGHTKVGVAAGDHAVIIWPLLMSMAKAKYYAMTSERITGAEAERIGMVTMALPVDEVYAKAQAIAEQLVGAARLPSRGRNGRSITGSRTIPRSTNSRRRWRCWASTRMTS